jgi:hypothetical protein
MARSGTTWVAELINCENQRRLVFEPFTPRMVPEASCFRHIQYLNPGSRNPVLVAQADQLLSGRMYNVWTDRERTSAATSSLIIKDIRCNLMLGWFQALYPEMPMVLVMRHPLAVAASLLKLGWALPLRRGLTDFQVIISQPDLLADFPIIRDVLEKIDQNDLFEQVVFEWAVFHLVPLSQCRKGKLFLIQYEALVLNPKRELKKLFRFLRIPYEWDRLCPVVQKPSATNFLKRNIGADRDQLLTGWKTDISDRQVQRADEILSLFGWEHLSKSEGHFCDAVLRRFGST